MTDTITLIPAQFAELRDRARRANVNAQYASTYYYELAKDWKRSSETVAQSYREKAEQANSDAAYWRAVSEGGLP